MNIVFVKYLRRVFREILGELSIEEIGSNPELMKCVKRIGALLV